MFAAPSHSFAGSARMQDSHLTSVVGAQVGYYKDLLEMAKRLAFGEEEHAKCVEAAAWRMAHKGCTHDTRKAAKHARLRKWRAALAQAADQDAARAERAGFFAGRPHRYAAYGTRPHLYLMGIPRELLHHALIWAHASRLRPAQAGTRRPCGRRGSSGMPSSSPASSARGGSSRQTPPTGE